ncbi:Mechanosensitive ion channel protein 10, partial [Bienertia sinuspersici]
MDPPKLHRKNDSPSYETTLKQVIVSPSSSHHENVSQVRFQQPAAANPDLSAQRNFDINFDFNSVLKFVLIVIVFASAIIPLSLFYCCILIISLATLPLLVVSLLITRIFQFIRSGYDYKRLTKFKHFIRGWLYIDVFIVLVGLWIFYPIAKYTVYGNLKPKIIAASKQLYFLGIIGCHKHDILRLKRSKKTKNEAPTSTLDTNSEQRQAVGGGGGLGVRLTKFIGKFTFKSWFQSIPKKARKRFDFEKRERIKNDLLFSNEATPTMDDLQRASRYFLVAKKYLLEGTYISDVLDSLKKDEVDKRMYISREELKQKIGDHVEENHIQASKLLKMGTFNQRRRETAENREGEQKGLAQSSTNSSSGRKINDLDQFEKAHRRCLVLANTLSSAEEVSGCLDKIISWLLIGALFIVWLLLTELATTKVLVLIASPMLAATFIFGEACKTLFHGILFVYVVHPYDVGDLCIIDKNMMEVTEIGIWTTTFIKLDKFGRQEVVKYPNTGLRNKVIVNHKTNFDWSDCVEFNIGHMKAKNLKDQEDAIHKNFEDRINRENRLDFLSSKKLAVSICNNNVNLVIHLGYKADNTKGWTYSGCVWRKNRLHAKFCLIMKDIITEFK